MLIELRQLRYFRRLARELSFSRAAASANISQSSLSEQIQRLEDVLSVQLVDRSARQIRLTVAGETLRDSLDDLFQHVDDVAARVRAASGQTRTTLRVGYSEMAVGTVMPAILHEFRERYPLVETVLREQSSIGAARALLDGEFDVVFAPGARPQPEIGQLALGAEPVLLCVSEASALAAAEGLAVADIGGHPIILPDEGSELSRYVQAVFAQAQIKLNVAARAGRALSILTLVAAEQGAAFLPRSLAGMIPAGVTLRPLTPPLSLMFSMSWRAASEQLACRRLVEVARAYLKAQSV